jgi:hypothetical protein
MQIENTSLRELLRQIVAGFIKDPVLRQNVEEECFIHLWRLEREKPRQTRSWYLQTCRTVFGIGGPPDEVCDS